jgi:type I restriction enzyme, S subunit
MNFNEWQTFPLEDCMEAIIDYRGKTPRKSSFGIPLITAKIVKDGRILEPTEFIPFDDYDERMSRGLPQAGDVVITTEGPLGEVGQLDNRKVSVGQRLITLRGKKGLLDNTFLKYLLMSDFVQHQLLARATGTTVSGIKQAELRRLNLLVPPSPTQLRIAEILSALDDKIEINRQTNATLDAIAHSIFKEWFIEFNFPNATGEILKSELGFIPKGWRVGSILEIADLLSGGTPSTSVSEYWDGDIEWVSAKDVSTAHKTFVLDTERKITKAGVDNSSTKVLPELTTIITSRGTVGNYCILAKPMAMNQTNYGLKAKAKGTNFFVFFSLGNLVVQLRQAAYGTIFDTVTTMTFEQSKIVIPPTELIQEFDSRITPIMQNIQNNLEQSATLVSLRNALLPKLMSGEIEV